MKKVIVVILKTVSALVVLTICAIGIDAYRLNQLVREAAETHGWVAADLPEIESVYLHQRPGFLDVAKDLLAEMARDFESIRPHRDAFNEYYHTRARWMRYRMQLKLDRANRDAPWIPDFLVRYPSNRWVGDGFIFSSTTADDIPDRLVFRFYELLSVADRRDLAGLRQHLRDRNVLDGICGRYLEAGRSEHIARRSCAALETEPMLSAWKLWFAYDSLASEYHAYFLGREARLATQRQTSTRLCNLAPYRNRFTMYTEPWASHVHPQLSNQAAPRGANYPWQRANPAQPAWGEISEVSLEPGSCTDWLETWYDREPGPTFVQARTLDHWTANWVNDRANEILMGNASTEDDVFVAARGDEYALADADLRQCVPTRFSAEDPEVSLSGIPGGTKDSCSAGEHLAGFRAAVSDRDGVYRHTVEAPNVSFLGAAEPGRKPEDLVQTVQELAVSVQNQMAFDREWSAKVLPYGLGAALHDVNGPFEVGVHVPSLNRSHSIFGAPRALQTGDYVLAINDQPVYGLRDLMLHLIAHARSRAGGIEVPVRIIVFRENTNYELHDTFYFNAPLSTWHPTVLAMLYGIAEVPSLGMSPQAICRLQNAGTALAKGFLNVTEGMCRVGEEMGWSSNCPSNSAESIQYRDLGECVWTHTQLRAYARQDNAGMYENIQYVAFVTPGSLRFLFGRSLARQMALQVGSARLGSRLSAAMLEAAESGLWSFNTELPGTPTAARLPGARLNAGIGLVSGFVFSGGK